jgi:hypothetical protein
VIAWLRGGDETPDIHMEERFRQMIGEIVMQCIVNNREESMATAKPLLSTSFVRNFDLLAPFYEFKTCNLIQLRRFYIYFAM